MQDYMPAKLPAQALMESRSGSHNIHVGETLGCDFVSEEPGHALSTALARLKGWVKIYHVNQLVKWGITQLLAILKLGLVESFIVLVSRCFHGVVVGIVGLDNGSTRHCTPPGASSNLA